MENFEDLHILVVGDIMLDKYRIGEVTRISAEAPVPIVHLNSQFSTLGGCGNVVRNLRELGVNVTCLASVGDDEDGERIIYHLKGLDVGTSFIQKASYKTTVKERIIADERKIQMIRLDTENTTLKNSQKIIQGFYETSEDNKSKDFDAIIISDYAKGVIVPRLMADINLSESFVFIDPKPQNRTIYGDSFLMTPNEKETKEMGGVKNLISSGAKNVLVTKGRRGMTLYDKDKSIDIKAEPVEVYNVSGAGDTVIAVMAVCLANKLSLRDSAIVANMCAGYVVTRPETSIVPKNIFMNYYNFYSIGS